MVDPVGTCVRVKRHRYSRSTGRTSYTRRVRVSERPEKQSTTGDTLTVDGPTKRGRSGKTESYLLPGPLCFSVQTGAENTIILNTSKTDIFLLNHSFRDTRRVVITNGTYTQTGPLVHPISNEALLSKPRSFKGYGKLSRTHMYTREPLKNYSQRRVTLISYFRIEPFLKKTKSFIRVKTKKEIHKWVNQTVLCFQNFVMITKLENFHENNCYPSDVITLKYVWS